MFGNILELNNLYIEFIMYLRSFRYSLGKNKYIFYHITYSYSLWISNFVYLINIFFNYINKKNIKYMYMHWHKSYIFYKYILLKYYYFLIMCA